MEQKLYQEYLKKWDTWLKDEEAYFKKKKQLVARNAPKKEFDKLDKFYGHDGFNTRQFGPWTVIYDKEDLLNPEFILPGGNKSFCQLKNTDQNIPSYWGKRIFDEHRNEIVGRVIGYGYDSGDDYIIARDDNDVDKGVKREICVMVNSHYKILEDDENL